jgi:lipoate-protein ligase A
MAFDEALLDAHEPGDLTLRLYAWSPFGLSLGYFQAAGEAREALEAEPALVLTRRLTGGGAIIHAHELTYALVTDAPSDPGGSRALYGRMNRAIVDALASAGVTSRERGGKPGASGGAFLCFERHADFDVTVEERKISGSAQRRKGRALLQHGSILLGPPPLGGEGLTSVESETGRRPDAKPLASRLWETAKTAFDADFEAREPHPEILQRAEELERFKYGTEGWIYRC